MGTLLLLKGDYEQSEKYLKKAQELGLDVAKSNLEELARKKANIDELKKEGK